MEESALACVRSIVLAPRPAGLARTPGSKRLLHVGMREKSIAQVAQDRAVYATRHVRETRHFLCRNMVLEGVPVGVGDGGAICDAVEPSPKCVRHAHLARLLSGVNRVSAERRVLQLLAS